MSNRRYSINEIEKISGIKAHTLRIWEQRHNILSPKRTSTNIRYYEGDDLKRLLNIRVLNTNGVKISKIAQMSDQELHQEVIKIWTCCEKFENQANALVVAMLELDEPRFEKIINRNIVQIGLERTMTELVYPFYNKVGLMWQTCSILPAQEHFISNLIRRKIIVAIDGQTDQSDKPGAKFLVFLPEGELHEIGLLFANYIIKARGGRTIYLGQSVPFPDIQSVYDQYEVDFLFTYFTSGWDKEKLEKYLNRLGSSFPDTKILVSGGNVICQKPKAPKNVSVLFTIRDLANILDAHSKSL